jgi:hypothetical protein
LLEITSAVLSARANPVNWHTRIDPLDLTRRPDDVIGEIGLVDDDDGRGATFQHQSEIALQTRQVEVATQRRHDEHDIDIRRQELRAMLACCLGRLGSPDDTNPD